MRLKSAVRRTGIRRHHLTDGRMCVERHVLARRPNRPLDLSPRILCYHSVGTPEWGINDVTPGRFVRHLDLALRAGRRFVPSAGIARGDGQPGDLALTFDDGLRSVASIAPVLRDYGIPWTLFVVSDWSEGHGPFAEHILGWRDIESLAAMGATIGNHSATHPNFGLIPESQVSDEIHGSRATIASRIGIATTEFAIPLGLPRDWTTFAHSTAIAAGHEHIYAQAGDRRSPGTVPRTMITRFDDATLFTAAMTGAYDNWLEKR